MARPRADLTFWAPVFSPYGVWTASLTSKLWLKTAGGGIVGQALAEAVRDLSNAGIPLNAPLRGYQFERRGSEEIPIHGGPGGVGVFNAINVAGTPAAAAIPTSATARAS